MGKGDRAIRRDASDRRKKKKQRERRQAEARGEARKAASAPS